MTQSTDRLTSLIEPIISELGFDLESLDIKQPQQRTTLIVAIDADAGISVDDIAQVSRALSAELDATNVMGEKPYVLEVTSRGVSRPLTLPRHWRRNEGRDVRVKKTDGEVVEGRIGAHDDTGVLINDRRIDYADMSKAVIQVSWSKGS